MSIMKVVNNFYLTPIRFYVFYLSMIFMGGCSPKETILVDNKQNGIFHHIQSFESEFVENRPVDIWLPDGYEKNTEQRYSVMYLHDGQFMFDNAASPMNKGIFMKLYALYVKLRYGTGLFWDVDKIATQLIKDEEINQLTQINEQLTTEIIELKNETQVCTRTMENCGGSSNPSPISGILTSNAESRSLEARSLSLETGSWSLEIRKCNLEAGKGRPEAVIR